MNKLYSILYILVLFWKSPAVCYSSVDVCITNCMQCKKMFGPYFQGKACADACVSSDGKIDLDCNIPETIIVFLKRLY